MNIDAVAMMREIRDDLSRKMQGMTWEEEREFIRNSIKSFDFITGRKNEDPLEDTAKERPHAGGTGREKHIHP